MILYFWAACAVVNWGVFLVYLCNNYLDIEKSKLPNFVLWGLSFSLIFGPIWTLGVILYHIGLYFEKNR